MSASPSLPSEGAPSASSSFLPPAAVSFCAGAAAGLIVDVGLFPIDTVKTRLQSVGGLRANGGLKGVYNGLGVVAMGSVPGGAIFFATYDTASAALLKRLDDRQKAAAAVASSSSSNSNDSISSNASGSSNSSSSSSSSVSAPALAARVAAGCAAECAACLVRVPVELIKQRLQVGHHSTAAAAWADILKEAAEASSKNGKKHTVAKKASSVIVSPAAVARVLYRGYPITVFREVPFAMVQMPLYEWLKAKLKRSSSSSASSPLNSSSSPTNSTPSFVVGLAPGFISGGVSAVATTPLDVTKTRIMTMRRAGADAGAGSSNAVRRGGARLAAAVMGGIVKEEGWRALFKGGMTRCVWISAGGALFFGTYEGVKGALGRQ